MLALLSACSGSSAEAGPPTAAQIRALLTSHAAAVRDHDRAAFLAGVAPGAASAAFRTAQAAEFDNLAKLSLSTWRYTLATRTDDTASERSATRRLSSDAVIYQVTLTYGLASFDPLPTTRTLYWTFVSRGGKAVVAADSDLADVGGASWKGPWDFGPLVVGRGTSALVLAHQSAGNLSTVVAQVDAAVPAVTAVWGSGWVRRVVVLIPSSADELRAEAGLSSELTTDVAASTVSDGSDPLTRAALGLRLVVNPPALAKLSTQGREITLRHEITHIATGAVTSDSSPRWLVEGFADYVGLLGSGQSPTTAAAELTRAVRAGQVPTALPAETAFDTDSTTAEAYEASWLACRLIAQRYGQAALLRFYRAVGVSYDPEHSVQNALASVLHTTLPAFTARWRAYLRTELG